MAEALCWNLRRRSEGCTNASSLLIDCWNLKRNEAVDFWQLLFLPARFILLSHCVLTVVWGEFSGSCFGLMRQIANSFIEVFPVVALCFYCKNSFVGLAVIFWWFVGLLKYSFCLMGWLCVRCFCPLTARIVFIESVTVGMMARCCVDGLMSMLADWALSSHVSMLHVPVTMSGR